MEFMSKRAILDTRKGLWLPALVGFALSLALVGCGGSGGNVSGTVKYQGKEVENGTLTFTPVASDSSKSAGKPAAATVENGKFRVSEPVSPGKVRVTYNAPTPTFPEGANPKPGDEPPKSPYQGLIPKDSEITVKAGSSTIEVDLVAPGAAPAGGR